MARWEEHHKTLTQSFIFLSEVQIPTQGQLPSQHIEHVSKHCCLSVHFCFVISLENEPNHEGRPSVLNIEVRQNFKHLLCLHSSIPAAKLHRKTSRQ